MQIVRAAVVGTGSMGRKYAQMIAQGKAGAMTLAAVVCRHAEAQQWAQQTLPPQVLVCASAEELYTHADAFDAVLVVTPHKSHPELAQQAFAHGKHVLCDKPSASSLAPALEMNRAARQSGLVFAMMFHQRCYRKYRRLKELLQSGQLGQVQRILLENSRYFRTWQYHRSGSWRSSWNGEGGGALLNQGQHILDIWQWLFGMPESIYAMIPYGKYNDFAVDDEATLLMEYPHKRTAALILTTGEGTWTERLKVVGTRGTALLEDDTLTLHTYAQDTETYRRTASCTARQQFAETTVQENFGPQEEPYPEMLANFADAILHGTPLIAPGVEGVRALELTDAAYRSAWRGEKVSLPLDAAAFERELQKQMREEQNHG